MRRNFTCAFADFGAGRVKIFRSARARASRTLPRLGADCCCIAAIGPEPSGIFCADCGTELLRTSRSWKPPARYGPPLCPHCLSLERDARSRKWRVESLRSRIVAEARVQARAMEWRAAAELVLAFPPLSFPPLSQKVSCGLTWTYQGTPPALDASGEIDYGTVDEFTWTAGEFAFVGHWGQVQVNSHQALKLEIEVVHGPRP